MVVVGLLAFLCFIASLLVYGVLTDRQTRYAEAVEDISTKWATEQAVGGPALAVPFVLREKSDKGVLTESTQYLTVAPTSVNADVQVDTETRSRGIFSVPVYTATITVSGEFTPADIAEQSIPGLQWNNATFVTGVSDTHGFMSQPVLTVGKRLSPFEPGGAVSVGSRSTMHADLPVDTRTGVAFSYTFALRGTQSLLFEPIGRQMSVAMSSPWTAPSFVGSTLPAEYAIDAQGFRAHWNVSPWWAQSGDAGGKGFVETPQTSFGVKLIDTITPYTLVDRSIKYAILFIVLTFMVFFLAEVLTKQRVHPFQYLLVGAALCLFYLLLLSLTEHIGFLGAYFLSTVGTVALITWYSKSVLQHPKFAWIVGGLLVVLYAYLFTLLQIEDYALLIGSVMLFVILAAVMHVTRRVEWYKLDQ